jgi:hypothetical protein
MATVQRKIAEVLARDVDDAMRVDELCREIYGEANVRKKHRASVISRWQRVTEDTRQPWVHRLQRLLANSFLTAEVLARSCLNCLISAEYLASGVPLLSTAKKLLLLPFSFPGGNKGECNSVLRRQVLFSGIIDRGAVRMPQRGL